MIEALVLPPGVLLLIMLAGLALLPRRRNLGMLVVGAAAAGLYLFSTPWVGYSLLEGLQDEYAAVTDERWEAHRPDALVVLGGGRFRDPPEYESDTVSSNALVRLRYAAHLYRAHDIPILVSGGAPHDAATPEAALMREALEQEFGIPVRWVEGTSRTTWENAVESDDILAQDGIVRVAVVTQAWHMPRAIWSFRAAGLDPLPAPTAFERPQPPDEGLAGLLPRYYAFQLSALALRERLGLTWYRMRLGGWRPAADTAP